jgi:hypothetical protein
VRLPRLPAATAKYRSAAIFRDCRELFERGLKVVDDFLRDDLAAGRFELSSRLSSFSQKMSRLILSRWINSSCVKERNRSLSCR